MIDLWRTSWSKTKGTTDKLAPFGIVTLASGGSEGGPDIGGMRWSQTGNYGVLPNLAMPNTFLAHAYDLGDPWQDVSCLNWHCCPFGTKGNAYNATACAQHIKDPTQCVAACRALTNTSYYMGPIQYVVRCALFLSFSLFYFFSSFSLPTFFFSLPFFVDQMFLLSFAYKNYDWRVFVCLSNSQFFSANIFFPPLLTLY